MEPNFLMLLSLAHIVVALTATILNVLAVDRRIRSATTRDGERFRTAIKAELEELNALCVENTKRLSEAKSVLSMRAAMGVYRGNLGRLTLLGQDEIRAIVAVYARTEKLEHLLAASMIASGTMFYKMPPNGPPADDLVTQMWKIRGTIRTATLAMNAASELDPQPAEGAKAPEKLWLRLRHGLAGRLGGPISG